MTIRFLLINLLVLFISGCATKLVHSNTSTPKSFISQTQKGLVFRSTFEYKSHHFSGLIVAAPENENVRIKFLSEMGPTIMDFRFTPENMEVIKMPVKLNKKLLLKQLELDLRLTFLMNLHQRGKIKIVKQKKELITYKVTQKKKHTLVIEKNKDFKIVKAQRRGIGFDRVSVNFIYGKKNKIPETITLEHSIVDLELKLSLI